MSTIPDPATTDWVPLWSLSELGVSGREIASMRQTGNNGPTGVTQTGDGDLLYTFPAAYYEAVAHHFELWLVATSSAGNELLNFRLHDGATLIQEFQLRTPVTNPGSPFFFRGRFTPTVGMHNYTIRWRGGTAGSYTLPNSSYPLLARIVEVAPVGGLPLPPTYGITLPTTPVDGQEHVLVDSLTNPTYKWRFRYNAGSSSAYKWEFIGGAPKSVGDGSVSSHASSAYSGAVANTTFTLPAAGDYMVWFSGYSSAGSTTRIIGLHSNGVLQIGITNVGAGTAGGHSFIQPIVGAAAGHVIDLRVANGDGTATNYGVLRYFIQPSRVA